MKFRPVIQAIPRLSVLCPLLASLFLFSCARLRQGGPTVLEPSGPGAVSRAELTASLERILSDRGYQVSGAAARQTKGPLKEFTRLKRYSRYRGGEFSFYAGPDGRAAFDTEYRFFAPYQFPTEMFNTTGRELRDAALRKGKGWREAPVDWELYREDYRRD